MILINTHELFRETITYSDREYEVIQVLDNGLVLVVLREEYERREFPLQTYIIPDPMYAK